MEISVAEALLAERMRKRLGLAVPLDLSIDGNMFCALYGPDLQAGVGGFGPTVAKALADFETRWRSGIQRDIGRISAWETEQLGE